MILLKNMSPSLKISYYIKMKSLSMRKINKRSLHIKKQNNWKWEFGEKQEKPPNKNLIARQKRNEYITEKLTNTFCENCNSSAISTELFIHWSGLGPYCEECLDILSDDEGGTLSCYK